MIHLFEIAPTFMPALIVFLGIMVALMSFVGGAIMANRGMEKSYFAVLKDLGIAVAGGKVHVFDASRFLSHPKIKEIIDARMTVVVQAMDSKSILENSGAIAQAISKELRAGNPELRSGPAGRRARL